MAIVFEKPKSLTDVPYHYCPGCTHGIVHRLVAEAIDALGIEGRTVGIAPVGCSVMAYDYFKCDMIEASHGRAPAVATGVKRSMPDNIVFTYQGDGDLASIGLCETVSTACRGENITIIFINNAIYGMTGGQMAPTSLIGQVTQTSPYGRDAKTQGMPIRICELLATLDAPAYLERVAVNSVAHVRQAKKAILKAFKNQVEGKGFSLVEVVSTCPTNWGLTPDKACQFVEEKMIPFYPLGCYKDRVKSCSSELELEIGVSSQESVVRNKERREFEMTYETIMVGFGGQGLLFSGKVLAHAALIENKELSWLPSYGPEMRGGTCNCSVIVSDDPVGSPIIAHPNVLMVMNEPSLDKFEDTVAPGGTIFVDSSLIGRKVRRTDVEVVYIPATKMATDMEAKSLANMIILGAIVEKLRCVNPDMVATALKETISARKAALLDLNLKAVEAGREFIRGQKA